MVVDRKQEAALDVSQLGGQGPVFLDVEMIDVFGCIQVWRVTIEARVRAIVAADAL